MLNAIWTSIKHIDLSGWSSECFVFYTIYLHWCEKCSKWVLATENWWLFLVRKAKLIVFISPIHQTSVCWVHTLDACFWSVMQIRKMPTGLAFLLVAQPWSDMFVSWVDIIWYVSSLFVLVICGFKKILGKAPIWFESFYIRACS